MDSGRRWPLPLYRIQIEFRAPLDFVYRWCTDFRTDDAGREGKKYERRILLRSNRRVVFEDLWWEPDGWRWRRHDVRLYPPNRWRTNSIGNEREARNDYRLTRLTDGRTRLEITVHRRPGLRQPRPVPQKVLERELLKEWRNFGKSLDADFDLTQKAPNEGKARVGRQIRVKQMNRHDGSEAPYFPRRCATFMKGPRVR
jgi:hypothetical protein